MSNRKFVGEKRKRRRVWANTKQMWGHGLQVLDTEFGEWWVHNGTASQVVQFPREPSSSLTPSTTSLDEIIFTTLTKKIRSEFQSYSWVFDSLPSFFVISGLYTKSNAYEWYMNQYHLCFSWIQLLFFFFFFVLLFWAFVKLIMGSF